MGIPLADFWPLVDSFISELAGTLQGLEDPSQVVILSLTNGSTIAELAFVPARRQSSFPAGVKDSIVLALWNGQVWLPSIYGLVSIEVPGHDPVCILPRSPQLEATSKTKPSSVGPEAKSEGSPPVAGPQPIFSVNESTTGLLTTTYVDVQFSRPCQGVGVIRDCGPSGCQLKLGSNLKLMAGLNESHVALQVTHTETGNADVDVSGALLNGTAMNDLTAANWTAINELAASSTGRFAVNVTIAEEICRDASGIASTSSGLLLTGNTTASGGKRENKLVVTLRYTISPSCGNGDKSYLRTAIYLGDDRVQPRLTSTVGSFSKDRRVPVFVDLSGEVVKIFNASAFTVIGGYVEDNITTSLDGTWFNITLVIDESATVTIYLEEGALYDGLSGAPSRRSNTLSITHVPGDALTDAVSEVGATVKTVLGVVAVTSTVAGVMSSLGMISPAGVITASPATPTGMLGGIGHLQTIAMVSNLPMELPGSFQETTERWHWLNLNFFRPWDSSICGTHEGDEATAGVATNNTTTDDVGGGGPKEVVQGAWAWLQDGAVTAPVELAQPDQGTPRTSQVALMTAECTWDIALQILFWAVILVIALLVIHKLVIRGWHKMFPRAALPELLRFPRIELYLLIIIAPPLAQAGALLISASSPLAIVFGVLMLLAGPCAIFCLALFIMIRHVLRGQATEFKQESIPPPVRPAWMRPLERVWYALFGYPVNAQWQDIDHRRAVLSRFGPLFESFKGPVQDVGQTQSPGDEKNSCWGRWMGWNERIGQQLGTSYAVVEIFKRVFVAFMLGISGKEDDDGSGSQHWGAWVQVTTVLCVLAVQLAVLVRRRPFIDRFMQASETLAVACEVQLFIIILLLLAEVGNKSRVSNALEVTMHLSILCNLLAQMYESAVLFISGLQVFRRRLMQARQRIRFDSFLLKGKSAVNMVSSLRQTSRQFLRVWTYANTLFEDGNGIKADAPVSGMPLTITSLAKHGDAPMATAPACKCADSQGHEQRNGIGHHSNQDSAPAVCPKCSAAHKDAQSDEEAFVAELGEIAADYPPRDDTTAGRDASYVPPLLSVATARLHTVPLHAQGYAPPFTPASSVALTTIFDASRSSQVDDAAPQLLQMPRDMLGGHQSTGEDEHGLGTASLNIEQVLLREKEGASRLSGEMPQPCGNEDVGGDQPLIAGTSGSTLPSRRSIKLRIRLAVSESDFKSRMPQFLDALSSQLNNKGANLNVVQVSAASPPPVATLSQWPHSKALSPEQVGTCSNVDTRREQPGTASDTWTALRSEPSSGNSGSTLPPRRSIKLRARLSISENDFRSRMSQFLDALSSQLPDIKADVNIVQVSAVSPARPVLRPPRRRHSEGMLVSKPYYYGM
eukprot:jgi/Mesvir1/5561/Mv15585-RA.2